MDKNITMEELETFEKAFDKDLAKQVAMNAVTSCGVVKAARSIVRTGTSIPFPWSRGKSPTRSRAAAAGCLPP